MRIAADEEADEGVIFRPKRLLPTPGKLFGQDLLEIGKA